MAVRSGLLRHRLLLRSPKGSQDTYGQVSEDWEDRGSVWASITPLRGEERTLAQQQHGMVTHKIRIRHRDGVAPKMRAEEHTSKGVRVFEFMEVLNILELDESIEIMAKELV